LIVRSEMNRRFLPLDALVCKTYRSRFRSTPRHNPTDSSVGFLQGSFSLSVILMKPGCWSFSSSLETRILCSNGSRAYSSLAALSQRSILRCRRGHCFPFQYVVDDLVAFEALRRHNTLPNNTHSRVQARERIGYRLKKSD
jgi:hypothetical protein